MNLLAIWKWVVSVVVAVWAGLSVTVHVLMYAMAVDYLLGWAAAIMYKDIDTDQGWKGLVKKCTTLLLIWLCHEVTKPLNIAFDAGEVVALAYLVNEIASVGTLAARLGVPLPPVILESLAKVRKVRISDKDLAKKAGIIMDASSRNDDNDIRM